MKYLLDTNTVSYFAKGDPAVLARIKAIPPDQVAITSVTEMEIEFGLELDPLRAKKLAPVLHAFVSSIKVLPYASAEARTTAIIRAGLKKAGKPVGYYDLLITATAVRHGLTLVTSNTRELSQIDGLTLEDWRVPNPSVTAVRTAPD